MNFATIDFDVYDNVATITLNRPDKLNAFNNDMAADLSSAWTTVRDDDDIHVAVLRANGERAFSSGVDVDAWESPWFRKSNPWNTVDPGAALSPKFQHRVWKPVVVAVHGICAGSAHYFINEADIIICSDDAVFFDPHLNAGTVSALETIGLVARNVPLGDVLRWALMGSDERITAATALRIGLVTEVVPNDELRARAHAIARSIAQREPRAVQGTVRAVWESLDMTRTMALQNGMAYTVIGNAPPSERTPRGPRVKPTLR